MADWITIPATVNNQVVRAELFQGMWTNLYTLKDPMFTETLNPGSTADAWTSDVTTETDIDADAYQCSFTSSGNPLLAIAQIRFSHASANGIGHFLFVLDGVRYGNSSGLMRCTDWDNAHEVHPLGYIFENVAAGSHTLKVQVSDQTGLASASEIWKDSCLGLHVVEF